ncbi:hypothetical protein DENSPDRAFT_884254 [Dentipellis sp. KUC8613]|nr:hypothetical protein DENSPDRAFT_884254 [Dentipellis sp. KUC8613]
MSYSPHLMSFPPLGAPYSLLDPPYAHPTHQHPPSNFPTHHSHHQLLAHPDPHPSADLWADTMGTMAPSPSLPTFHDANQQLALLYHSNLPPYPVQRAFQPPHWGAGAPSNLSALPAGTSVSGALDPNTGVFSRTTEHPRMRTAQACEKCRVRKAKCSGDHPSCARCLSRGLQCEYAPERKMRGPNKPKPAAASTSPPSNPASTSKRGSSSPRRPSTGVRASPQRHGAGHRGRAATLPSLPGLDGRTPTEGQSQSPGVFGTSAAQLDAQEFPLELSLPDTRRSSYFDGSLVSAGGASEAEARRGRAPRPPNLDFSMFAFGAPSEQQQQQQDQPPPQLMQHGAGLELPDEESERRRALSFPNYLAPAPAPVPSRPLSLAGLAGAHEADSAEEEAVHGVFSAYTHALASPSLLALPPPSSPHHPSSGSGSGSGSGSASSDADPLTPRSLEMSEGYSELLYPEQQQLQQTQNSKLPAEAGAAPVVG